MLAADAAAQKPKLRVGKTKAKADNFTDTSFKAKCGCSAILSLASAYAHALISVFYITLFVERIGVYLLLRVVWI